MIWLIWLLLSWSFAALANKLLGTRLAARGERIPTPMRVAVALGSGAVSFALVWWLFDVPGLLESQRLMAQGDLEAALQAYHPLWNPDPMVVLPLGMVVVSAFGIHMAARPEWWFRNGFPGKVPGDVAVDPRAVRRFRVYGVVIAVAGLFAVVVTALTFLK